ncbi:DNA topoisomerase [Pseudomonas sp. WS 5532]|uniref:DNA topoisomerase n=1 Tax=Pseudomonas sp. WS 5532 TaxID=2717495 RepID=UPI0014751DD6|nr:DNA topoisomerase [Pseudomonas sp. WS 5532]NMX77593.1 DNA topoisomerase [Pseudomonas sp. WS 5532]
MKVYIAEKPKLGRAIVAVLSKSSPVLKKSGAYWEGKDWAVCCAVGHILSQKEPDFYIGAKFPDAKKGSKGRITWDFAHLPLFPGHEGLPGWTLEVDRDKADLFKTIKSCLSKATVIVNAGDPDREGQLLIDEILLFLKNTKPVRRVHISAFDETTVANGLKAEKNNADFVGTSDAALSRSRADWLCGMNLSRVITLHAKEHGFGGSHIAYGRVMTTLLGLIVQRDLLIQNFIPVDYFFLTARFAVTNGEFKARWKPHPGQSGLDDEGRLIDRRVADQLNAAVKDQNGRIAEYVDQDKSEGPPLPFSVDKLQVLASKKYGYKSDAILKALQSLYEQHELTTYPRSDCQFLPESQLSEAPAVFAAVTNNLSFDDEVLKQTDLHRKSRAWNTDKAPVHHAIIPTDRKADISVLSKIERDLYDEICRRYLAQFQPNYRFREVQVIAEVSGQRFSTSGTTPLFSGWKVLYPGMNKAKDGAEDNTVLPPMAVGDSALCKGLDIQAKKTTPPDHFTDGTLLDAMINVHKFVTDEKIQAIFKQMLADRKSGDEDSAAGLGTSATRHTFVPKLVDLGQAEWIKPEKGSKKKEDFIVSTAAGRAIIQALPPALAKPDMTAMWEMAMREIEAGRSSVERFESMQRAWITKVIAEIRSKPLLIPHAGGPAVGGPKKERVPAEPTGKNCPKCNKQLMKRPGPKGFFIGCSGYPGCKHTEQVAA